MLLVLGPRARHIFQYSTVRIRLLRLDFRHHIWQSSLYLGTSRYYRFNAMDSVIDTGDAGEALDLSRIRFQLMSIRLVLP